MKKIIIGAVIAMSAFAINAASVSWNADAFSLPGADGTYGSTEAGKNDVMGYLWEVSAEVYATYTADASLIYTEFSKDSYGDLGTATTSKGSTSTGKVSLKGTTDYAKGATAYAIVLYTYTDTDGKEWYVANTATYTMGDVDGNVASLNAYKGGVTDGLSQGDAITGWSTAVVPEPTSGLLLLIGAAGLALRRKQK